MKHVIEVKVSEWSTKPLKMIVEQALAARLIPTQDYRGLNKAQKRKLRKKVANSVKLSDIEVQLEEAVSPNVARVVTDWDNYVRESNYAEKLGVEIPMRRKTNKLYNKNLMFHNVMQPVDYVIDISGVEDHKIEGVIDESKSYLVEPLYAMGRKMDTVPVVNIYTKVANKTKKEGSYTADDLDQRSIKRVFSEEAGRHEFTRVRNYERTQFEGVYDYDQEIRPPKVDFVDWANTIHNEIKVDRAQLIEELKEFYYNHPKVVKELKGYYRMNSEVFSFMPSVEDGKVESIVSYGKFVSLLKETNEPVAQSVELEEVVEDYLEEKGIDIEDLR